MSDDFDDDLFLDDSFLREVDSIAATAVSGTTNSAPRDSSLLDGLPGWQASHAAPRGPTTEPSSRNPARRLNAVAGPSRPYGTTNSGLKQAIVPVTSASRPLSSEPRVEYDRSSASRAAPRSLAQQGVIPSSRLMRTSSGGEGFLQTHLNFRRDKQATKGKRWDRTAFAESGRRIGAERMKGKGKARNNRGFGLDDDEDLADEEEEDWGELLAPMPKPLVDINQAYQPQKHLVNDATVGTYIYPTNRSKREYQYEIVRACFTDNCLVALPTGLGKTFVAGVVMLNFYRWFPSGKIVFLAPTKPLVNQQIEACQLSCGIPSGDAAVMTGSSVSAKERAKLWDERRVFYCTPQTLDNDLKSGAVDPRDIVLAVFDEAHKASGSYAYTTILAYITAHHPYFRVLALTATPGADVPRVQAVVDALHISRIEIREAEAPEIRKYMNDKKTERHTVPPGAIIEDFRDRWALLMKPYVAKMVERDILTDRDLDIKRLKPFRLTAKRMEIMRDRSTNLRWAIGTLGQLEKMSRALGNLLEFSIGMFHTALTEISGGKTQAGKKSGAAGSATSLRNNYEFQKLLRDVEAEMNSIRIGKGAKTKADRHPKMVKTLELLMDHFQLAQEDEKEHGVKNDTRAMVFCSYRDCVLEVVDMINEHPALLRATKFVGQSQGKQEADKGFNQKEQKKTIQEFKDGKYNILVSTSIGEEGLDIGEVDFVVIYDMPKQSIKLLQRIGRTGRKRDGKVHVLMSENREDANWDTAQQTHREIQEEILHSRNLELFEDVEPLLPLGKFPKCVEQEMPVDPWDPTDQKAKRKLVSAKGKENEDPKGKPVKKRRGHEIPDDAPVGFKSVAELLKGKAKGRKRARSPSPIRSEEDDEDDEMKAVIKGDLDSLSGMFGSSLGSNKGKGLSASSHRESSKPVVKQLRTSTPAGKVTTKGEVPRRVAESPVPSASLDFFTPEVSVRRQIFSPVKTPPSPNMFGDVNVRELPDASPSGFNFTAGLHGALQQRLSPGLAAAAGFSQVGLIDLSWDDEGDLAPQDVDEVSNTSPYIPARSLLGSRSTDLMPPPAVPIKVSSSPAFTSPSEEATQFPVRRAGRRGPVIISSEERPIQDTRRRVTSARAPARRPARVDHDSSSPVRPRAGSRQRAPAKEVQAFLDVQADVSGSESPDEASSDEEDESDRLFAGHDFQPTQAVAGYDQRAVYTAGLSTQAAPRQGLAFKPRHDKEAFMAKARKPVLITDDEASGSASENEYELGSFVCDDGELSFDSSSFA